MLEKTIQTKKSAKSLNVKKRKLESMLKKKKSMLKLSEKVITNVEGKVNENTQKNHLTKEKVIYKVRKR